jgi:restriction endonuclease Mrr
MENFNGVARLDANYKDIKQLIGKYAELNTNKNLQTYIMSGQAEFIGLCRRVVLNYYKEAKVKITKTQMSGSDWADVVAEIDTPKWSDVVMFRFIRSAGAVGEFVVRDFQAHIKELKAGKGICMTAGRFSDEAKRFTQARLIDLVDKQQLESMLAALNNNGPQDRTKSPAPQPVSVQNPGEAQQPEPAPGAGPQTASQPEAEEPEAPALFDEAEALAEP